MTQRTRISLLLRWLDSLLSLPIKPFAQAPTLERYATNGYYFMGIICALAIFLLWMTGVVGGPVSQLPVWLREALNFLFGLIGVNDISTTSILVAPFTLVYVFIYFIKPVRLLIGEKFADFFFWTASCAINMGDWLIEHRWSSLMLVILLTATIAWGTYYLFEMARHNDKPVEHSHYRVVTVDEFSCQDRISFKEALL